MSTLSLEYSTPSASGPVGSQAASLGEFLLGPENALVGHSIGLALDESGHPTVNIEVVPLTISAPTGLGKSELLRALLAAWTRQQGSDSVLLTTATDFARNYATAVKLLELPRFQQRYQRYACLLVDDLDQLVGKQVVQEQLATIVEHRQRHHRPTVITARQPLTTLNLSSRLTSRLAGGLTLSLQLPSQQTRRELVRRLGESLVLRFEPEAIDKLSEMDSLTVPQLTGLLNRLKQAHWLRESRPPVSGDVLNVNAEQVTALLPTSAEIKVDSKDIIRATARYFGLPQRNLTGSSRRKLDVLARSMAMYLIRELTGSSYLQVGKQFGGRDHTTVMHAHKKIGKQQQTDAGTRNASHEIQRRLNELSPSATARRNTSARQPNTSRLDGNVR